MNPRLRVMGLAMVDLEADDEFRTRLRSLVASNTDVEKVKEVMVGYFMARGVTETEACLMTGMYAMGGLDGATIVEDNVR